MSLLPESNVRIRSGEIQTPIYEFAHPFTDSVVSVVGMIHIGTPKYYEAVTNYIDDAERLGSVVHYEFIRDDGSVLDEAIGIDRELEDRFVKAMGIMGEFGRTLLGGAFQAEELEYPAHWQNNDMTRQSFMEALGLEGVQRIADRLERMTELRERFGDERVAKLMRVSFKLLPLLMPLEELFGDSHERTVIVDQRNQIALNGVRTAIQTDPAQRITLLWGSGHAPGLKRGLLNFGYRQQSKQWLGALAV